MPLHYARALSYRGNKMKIYQLNYLSNEFYRKYNSLEYPEIENKNTRPYMVMLVKIDNNTFAVPFRTNISHSNCYKFKSSERPTNKVTGLDYTKAVIVNDDAYIGATATIDNKEYIELNQRYRFIIKQFQKFVYDYIDYVNGKRNFYNEKKFKYTTLKYFHKELGLEK